MSILTFKSEPRFRKHQNKIASFALLAVALAFILFKTTLAANMTIGNGQPVEYGQGVVQSTACDTSFLVTPLESFSNASGAGAFLFSGVTISGLDTTTQGCAGRTLKMAAYGQTGSALTTFSVAINSSGTFGSSDGSISNQTAQSSSSNATLTLTAPSVSASNVYKVSMETSMTILTCATGGTCVVGDTGPGGGIIYYVDNSNGFNCGATDSNTGSPTGGLCHYLEVAPNGWNTGPDPTLIFALPSYQSTAVPGVALDSTANNSSTGIGLGYLNSAAAVTQGNDTTTAPGATRAYRGGGKSDWYLPTSAELNLLCQWDRGVTQNMTTVCTGGALNSGTGASSAGFVGDYYASSSQRIASQTWEQQFGTANGVGNQGSGMKYAAYYVRPIRAF